MAEFGCTHDMPISFWTKSNPFYTEKLPLGKIDKIAKQRRHPMSNPNPDRLAGLTEEEKNILDKDRSLTHALTDRKDIEYLARSLATTRATAERRLALLRKWQWVYQPTSSGSVVKVCLECGAVKETYQSKHKPDCALAAELRGGGE